MVVFLFLAAAGYAQAPPDVCKNPEISAFDFQIGEWLSENGKAAHRIAKTLDGCGIEEVWMTIEGKETARALKSFDNGSHAKNGEKRWYYTWTARGFHQLWEGRKEDGKWRFYRVWWLEGKPMLSRTYWEPLSGGQLARVVEQSVDDGKTWRPHVNEIFSKKTLITVSRHNLSIRSCVKRI